MNRLMSAASHLITRYGGEIIFVRQTSDEYDPANLSPSITEKKFTVCGAKMDYSQREIDGTRVRIGDQRIYLKPKDSKGVDFLPLVGDDLIIQGERWNVVDVRKHAPANVVYVYDLQIRK